MPYGFIFGPIGHWTLIKNKVGAREGPGSCCGVSDCVRVESRDTNMYLLYR